MFKKLTLLLAFGILLSAVWANIAVYAQNNTTNTAVPPKIHTVKITTPTKGQQVPIGSSLIVSGTSSDNATSDCQVSVIANKIKPYQPTTASGPGGANDYSKWSFTLTPKYTAIKEGENKITAKYSCSSDPSLVSFSSTNVTGIAAKSTSATKQQQPVITGNNNAAKGNSSSVVAGTATPSTQSKELLYIGSGKPPGHRSTTSSTTSTCVSSGSGSSSRDSCTSDKAPGHRSTSSTTSTCVSSGSGSSSSGDSSNGTSCTSDKAPGHRSTSSRESTTQGSNPSQYNPFIFPFGSP
jgi:hypothetical protein